MAAPPKSFFEQKLGRPMTDGEYAMVAAKFDGGGAPASPLLPAAPPPQQPATELAPVVSGPSDGGVTQIAPIVSTGPAPKGWLPATPMASGPMDLLEPVKQAGTVPSAGFLPSAPAPQGGGVNLLPNVPKANPAAPVAPSAKPVELAPVVSGGTGGGAPIAKPPTGSLPLQKPTAPKFDPLTFGRTPGEVASAQHVLDAEGKAAGHQKGLAGIQVEAADDFAKQAAAMAIDADRQAAEAEARAKERKMALDRLNAEQEKAIEAFEKAEVNPERAWENAGTVGATMAVIGMALGAAASVITGGPNEAAKLIEQKIARDIDLQKAKIAKQGDAIAARRGLYAQYLQKFQSEDAAEAMAYEAYLRKAKADVNNLAAKTQNKEAKVQAAALSDALDARIQGLKDNRQIIGEKLYEQYQAQLAKQAQAAAAAQAAELKKRNEAIFKAQLGVAEERAKKLGGQVVPVSSAIQLPNGATIPAGSVVVLDKNGQIDMEGTEAAAKAAPVVTTISGFNAKGEPIYGQALAGSPDAAKKFAESQAAYTEVKRDIAIIKALREKHGGGALFSPEDDAKAKAAAKRIQIALKGPAFANLGALSGSDFALLEEQIPSSPLDTKAVGVFGADPIGTQVSELENYLDAKYKNAEANFVQGGAAANTALPLTKPKD